MQFSDGNLTLVGRRGRGSPQMDSRLWFCPVGMLLLWHFGTNRLASRLVSYFASDMYFQNFHRHMPACCFPLCT